MGTDEQRVKPTNRLTEKPTDYNNPSLGMRTRGLQSTGKGSDALLVYISAGVSAAVVVLVAAAVSVSVSEEEEEQTRQHN